MLYPFKKAHLLLALPVLCVAFISFTTHTFTGASTLTRYWQTDTVPEKNRGDDGIQRDIDQHLQQLDKAIEKLEHQLEQKDWNKAQADVQAAISKIDMEKIQQRIDEAMHRIDAQKIQLQAQEAIRKIDMEKMQQSLQEALSEVKDTTNWQEMKAQIKLAMKEAQKSMEEAKKINFEKLKVDMARTKKDWDKQKLKLEEQLKLAGGQMSENRLNMQQELQKAKVSVEKARAELQSYKSGIDEMEKNGLLNSREDYIIEFKNKELWINGVRQSQEAYDHYAPVFKKDNLLIKKEKGNFSVNPGKVIL